MPLFDSFYQILDGQQAGGRSGQYQHRMIRQIDTDQQDFRIVMHQRNTEMGLRRSQIEQNDIRPWRVHPLQIVRKSAFNPDDLKFRLLLQACADSRYHQVVAIQRYQSLLFHGVYRGMG